MKRFRTDFPQIRIWNQRSRRTRLLAPDYFSIDVNSAFVSWSATKLVRQGKPDIRVVPSVVSGDPSDRRSIITAASIPAKKLGIRVPEPVSMALRKCPQLVIVRGDWAWYKQCSDGFEVVEDNKVLERHMVQ